MKFWSNDPWTNVSAVLYTVAFCGQIYNLIILSRILEKTNLLMEMIK